MTTWGETSDHSQPAEDQIGVLEAHAVHPLQEGGTPYGCCPDRERERPIPASHPLSSEYGTCKKVKARFRSKPLDLCLSLQTGRQMHLHASMFAWSPQTKRVSGRKNA